MPLSQLALVASSTACAVAGALATPHAYTLITGCRNKPYNLLDSDSDDETITTGKSPRSLWQRVCIVLVGAVGTTAAFWSWMSTDTSTTAKIVQLVAWVWQRLILLENAC